MSEKLTEQKIEEMIQELLQERDVRIRDKRNTDNSDEEYLKTIGSMTGSGGLNADLANSIGTNKPFSDHEGAKDALLKLRDLDQPNKNILNLADFEIASELHDTDPAHKMAKWLSVNANKEKDRAEYGAYFPGAREYGKGANEPLKQPGKSGVQKSLDPKDLPFSDPQIYSARGGGGEFGGAILESFASFFKTMNANTLLERIVAISNVSKAMVDKDSSYTIKKFLPKTRQQLNAAVCMDYMAALFKEFDHGAGAYFFEMFAGLITGGVVSGKGMKGDDFMMVSDGGETLQGSTKFFSADKKADQALSGFEDDTEVSYLFAWKRESGSPGSASKSVADPNKILEIDLYQFSITKDKNNQIKAVGDVSTSISKDAKPKVLFNMQQSEGVSPTATLYLANKSGKQGFKQALEDQLNVEEETTRLAYNFFKAYIENTKLSSQLTKKYLADGNINDAKESLAALETADTNLNNLYTNNSAQGGFGIAAKDLKESKLQSLDDLIAETIRDIKKKTKK